MLGVPRKDFESYYGDITLAETIVSEHTNRWETNLPVYLCRNAKGTIQEIWKDIEPRGF